MVKRLYIVLAAVLFICLAPMPYGYFMIVRFVMMVAFGWLAYRYYRRKKSIAMWVFIIFTILFQPIYKIALGRMTWNIVDVLVAIFLVMLYIVERRMERGAKTMYQQLPTDKKTEFNNKIIFRIEGKLAPKELLYVATDEDKQLTELIEKNPELLEGWGKMIGFHIIFLPLLLERLRKKEVIQYRAPYLSEEKVEEVAIGNDFILKHLENVSDRDQIKQGFIRTEDVYRDIDGKDKVLNRFYPLSSNAPESLGDQLHRIGKQIFDEQIQHRQLLENVDDWEGSDDEISCRTELQRWNDDTDNLLEEVKERISKLRQRGISQYILEQLIHTEDKLSQLVITKDFRILLPDYHAMEIKMEPLVKAVYLLFLRHPEGILFKCLPDFREELTQIYIKLKPYGMSDKVLQSIEDVTNPLLNSINEKCARIRGAFLGQFDEYLAKHYYVDGRRGAPKKITIPRDLVIWE